MQKGFNTYSSVKIQIILGILSGIFYAALLWLPIVAVCRAGNSVDIPKDVMEKVIEFQKSQKLNGGEDAEN